jgi:hypothetical protein
VTVVTWVTLYFYGEIMSEEQYVKCFKIQMPNGERPERNFERAWQDAAWKVILEDKSISREKLPALLRFCDLICQFTGTEYGGPFYDVEVINNTLEGSSFFNESNLVGWNRSEILEALAYLVGHGLVAMCLGLTNYDSLAEKYGVDLFVAQRLWFLKAEGKISFIE